MHINLIIIWESFSLKNVRNTSDENFDTQQIVYHFKTNWFFQG